MAATEFFKVVGGDERRDRLVQIGTRQWLLIFGLLTEGDASYNWRKYYDHKPTEAEVRSDISALVNAKVDESILTGFKWNGKPVYLSTENQFNFKAAYDLAVQSEGANLPVKFKLGEDAEGKAVYHTFTALTSFADFITKAFSYIQTCLTEGWTEKDGMDYEAMLTEGNQ